MNEYNAAAIEVLAGLDPVRRRPGMYTDTERPNHLAQEVIDNAVDEALAGFAHQIAVQLHTDGSLSVSDDGRGMPVDIHPEEGVSGVEVILTRLHAGGKFSGKNYQFSGGLHGVGVSVVNALSQRLEVWVQRAGRQYHIAFASGVKITDLTVVGTASTSGTTVRFWPDPKFFANTNFSVPRLRHLLRAKAVLCRGLRMRFADENAAEQYEWRYQHGLESYLQEQLGDQETIPEEPFVANFQGDEQSAEWAVVWHPDSGAMVTESYVNLIPTVQGGAHVNGLRSGLLEGLRAFCELRNLLPRGIKIAPEDVWERVSYVLSVKLRDPQFTGQTKERLASRECAAFVTGIAKDAFSLWLHQHIESGERIAELAINAAQARLKMARKIIRKKLTAGPALPGKLADCVAQETVRTELFLVEGDSAGGSAKQARNRETQAILPLRGKILNTWEVDTQEILHSQEIHDVAIAIGVDPGSDQLDGLRYGKICILADADSDGAHIATLLCALFLRHFQPLVKAGHIYVAMPPLYRIDLGAEVYYALDESEKQGILERITAEKKKGQIHVQRFKGLGEMNPLQLRETTLDPDTRRLVQLTLDNLEITLRLFDLLLARTRSAERRQWLENKGNLANLN